MYEIWSKEELHCLQFFIWIPNIKGSVFDRLLLSIYTLHFARSLQKNSWTTKTAIVWNHEVISNFARCLVHNSKTKWHWFAWIKWRCHLRLNSIKGSSFLSHFFSAIFCGNFGLWSIFMSIFKCNNIFIPSFLVAKVVKAKDHKIFYIMIKRHLSYIKIPLFYPHCEYETKIQPKMGIWFSATHLISSICNTKGCSCI